MKWLNHSCVVRFKLLASGRSEDFERANFGTPPKDRYPQPGCGASPKPVGHAS